VQEWVRGWLFSGFGWNGLGVALHQNLAMIQAADLAGVLGLSWVIAFCNVMAVIIVRRIIAEIGPQFLQRVRWEFSVTMALIAGLFAYGVRPLSQRPPAGATELKVAMIQPNVPELDKWDSETEDRRLAELDVLTKKAAEAKPDLIVWPESALPRGMMADEANYNFVKKETQYGDYGLLLGTILTDVSSDATYNGAVLLSEHATNFQFYRKIHLVPYGEYLPMRRLLEPIAGNLVPGDFAAGKTPVVFSLPNPPVRLAPLICFEDTLGDLTRRFVANGAELLVNMTNDGWFLESAGAEQHFANAIFRAVENRRPLIRCTNTGISGSVDPVGRVDRWAPPFVKAGESTALTRTISVVPRPTLTFYTRWGDWIAFLSCIVVLWNLGLAIIVRRLKETPEPPRVTNP
jgi:apolipoprotein N-acyltransferase